MGTIIDVIKLLPSLFSTVMAIINLLKGQPKEVQKQALQVGHAAIKAHCEGVACPAEIKL